jgi:uncharacterized protein
MTKRPLLTVLPMLILLFAPTTTGEAPRFHVLVFYSTTVEGDHVQFAKDALKFLSSVAAGDRFQIETTTNWDDLKDARLKQYQLVVWLNESPKKPEQRLAFQRYMEHGGAWLGFHASGYNDKDTGWPWFVDFLGGAVFTINSWPPLPARLIIEQPTDPVTANLPASYLAPSNEWYVWKPSPRGNASVRVLVTLDPTNYPLGLKDVILAGDCPVVWTNTKYKMVYMNMGHGGRIFSNATQNQLIENAVRWLGTGGGRPGLASGAPQAGSGAASSRAKDREEEPVGIRISPQAVVVNPKTNKVYAVNNDEGTLTIVSSASGAARTIKVGRLPSTIGVNSATNRIYVGNAEDGTVSVVDGNADRVLAMLKVGSLPYVVNVNSTSNKIYVSKTFSNTTTVIDGATNQVRILNTGVQASAMVSSAELNRTYLINLDDTVTILDSTTDATSKIHAGKRAWGLALNPARNKIYIGDSESSTLSIVDGKSGSVRTVQVGEIPIAIAVDSAANRVYVANYASNSVTVLDGGTDAVLATISVGVHPQAIAADPATHTVYVANTGSHSVSVVSGKDNTLVGTVDVGGVSPYAVAATNDLAYVKCFGRDDLVVVDPHQLNVRVVSAMADAQ